MRHMRFLQPSIRVLVKHVLTADVHLERAPVVVLWGLHKIYIWRLDLDALEQLFSRDEVGLDVSWLLLFTRIDVLWNIH